MNNPDKYVKMNKDRCYLEIAKTIAKRSHDSETQHGCVLVKSDKILSVGFNGFPSGFPDDKLPNTRPFKHNYILHSELNSIINAAKNGVSTDGASAYITGRPCCECLKSLIQAGIKTIYIGDTGHKDKESTQKLFDELVVLSKIELIQM